MKIIQKGKVLNFKLTGIVYPREVWYNFSGNSPMLVIYADANGFQKPNVLGKDVFVYVFSERGLLPAGRDKTDTEIESECKSTGYFCFEKYVRNNWEIPAEDVW